MHCMVHVVLRVVGRAWYEDLVAIALLHLP